MFCNSFSCRADDQRRQDSQARRDEQARREARDNENAERRRQELRADQLVRYTFVFNNDQFVI